jgi:uncharacterized protein
VTLLSAVLLALASAAAGAINSIAGGGTLISFPAAIACGLSPVVANASNTVALVPGSLASAWAYRKELGENRAVVVRFLAPSVVGGTLGALLVLAAPERVFELVVPWLVLGATALICFKDALQKRIGARGKPSRERTLGVGIGIFVMALYGGYFGAGIGIITLAMLTLLTPLSIHQMNAMKTLIASAVNGAAAVLFLMRGTPNLRAAGVMAVGSVAGGYLGARVAQRVPARAVRLTVVGIGLGLSLLLFARWFRQTSW